MYMEENSIKKFKSFGTYQVGEKFLLDGFVFVCKEPDEEHHCLSCAFLNSRNCVIQRCLRKYRRDGKNVCFDFEDTLYDLLDNAHVGEIIKYRDRYIKVEGTNKCDSCIFRNYCCNFNCLKSERKDHKNVCFVAVGE